MKKELVVDKTRSWNDWAQSVSRINYLFKQCTFTFAIFNKTTIIELN